MHGPTRHALPATVLGLALAPLLATGCSGPTTPVESPTPVASSPETPPQRGIPYSLYTHCGIDELTYEGLWYQRVDGPLDTGGGNPPRDWDNPFHEGWLLVEGDRATFTDDEGHEVVFEVREGATAPINACA